MSSQVISETCGITMYKGRGRFPSVLRLRKTLILDKKPPVTLSILRMVDKAFYLVITTFNPAFEKPFRGQKGGLTLPFGLGISGLSLSPLTSNSRFTSTRTLKLFSLTRETISKGPSHRGRSLEPPSWVVSLLRSQTWSPFSRSCGSFLPWLAMLNQSA